MTTNQNNQLAEILTKIAKIEERQAEALAALVSDRERAPLGGMGIGQAGIELRFRALRNALGNMGRRGETDLALRQVELHPDDTPRLVFVDGLPFGTEHITLFLADGKQRAVAASALTGQPPQLLKPGEVRTIQFDDEGHRPLAFALVRRVPAAGAGPIK
ncbi:hypothetical protein [Micromonospora sp. NPDC047738]|uniref:hypothetical protein n=1 Tax=unclassified Micromonospora TaxID=2617518 RepID=UPI0033C0C59B